MPENKHSACGVMKAVQVELFLPTQDMAAGWCTLVERLRAASMFTLSGSFAASV